MCNFFWELLSKHTRTHQTECSTWTTKAVSKITFNEKRQEAQQIAQHVSRWRTQRLLLQNCNTPRFAIPHRATGLCHIVKFRMFQPLLLAHAV